MIFHLLLELKAACMDHFIMSDKVLL